MISEWSICRSGQEECNLGQEVIGRVKKMIGDGINKQMG